nr:recombinase family protein [Shigella sonnei]
MLIGYVRVSTNEQNTALQRNALESAGCELIFEDKASGKKAERPGLKKVLRMLSRGDTLVVWKLDRLGRSMRHLVVLVEELRDRGINFRSLTDSIDTSTPMGRFFFGTVAKLAMRQPFVLFKGLTFQKLCLPGAFRPGDHHNKMLRPGLCVVHASPQYL